VFESIEVEYPSPDAIVEKITADGDVRFVRQIKLKDGLQVEAVTRTDSAQSINRWTNEYTDSGQVSLSYFYDDIDDAVQYARYAYDEHGNETACWLYNGYDDQLISEVQRQYKYDINGNWTLQTLFTDKYAEVVTVRTITYY
jgi:hypothetical protein